MTDAAAPHPAGRLREEAAAFAAAHAERLLIAAGRGLGRATEKLNDIAEGRETGLMKMAVATGRKTAEGKSPVRAAVEAGAAGLKDNLKERITTGVKDGVKHTATGLKDTAVGLKDRVTPGRKSAAAGEAERAAGDAHARCLTIVEDLDVGVPLREAYDQWTQFQEFSGFTRGVRSVEQVDDVTTEWEAKVLWFTRSWTATITEQVPDERIAWTSEGGKGTTRGVVTFHEVTPTLTRVLLVIEYFPRGLVERTGSLWRAQGRRARLDLKNFRRFVMLRGAATGEWRGEIDRSEVVVSHDEAVADEEPAADRDEADGDDGGRS
ncbi:SRPBCC family protein [Streptomyces sp. RFCAC02]|uniref:SRPBCC family protein n=1 Tax=Streptomyces sp. RFCAC02 TaxID=2499143 RepID=UPI00102216E9|nr:SRPBCC family protein [Streptomyces sp. RFCAC02]